MFYFERALETQRLRLLRHVARLGALVAFMSFGPLSNRLPRWVRSLVIYLLRPAEDAANCMVQVMICLIANGRCPSRPRAKMSYVSNTHDLQFHDAPSTPTAHKVDTPLLARSRLTRDAKTSEATATTGYFGAAGLGRDPLVSN